ncbi:MAG: FAD-binding domain-containing protein [Myxococcota bacterium]
MTDAIATPVEAVAVRHAEGDGALRRDFADRDDLVAYCREQFPSAVAVDDHVSPLRGGRAAAQARVDEIRPGLYGRTRNALDGAVTRLSPYLRHGVVSLAAMRDEVLTREKKGSGYKLINELAWRDYYRRVLAVVGDDVWRDREPYKTGWAADAYAEELPEDIEQGTTGIDFIDAMVAELHATGYLHNQARMKLAAYVVHFRRVSWQAGARWFLRHLLDGDVASNNLSWQWVASTFGHKPYIFNQANLIKVTDGAYRGEDTRGVSPFSGSYERISARLFRGAAAEGAT